MAGERDQGKGMADKLKGKVKRAVGELTDDEEMKREGTWDKTKGTVEEKKGEVKEKVSRKIDDM